MEEETLTLDIKVMQRKPKDLYGHMGQNL